MKIDAHQHFWSYNSVVDDIWMRDGYEFLRRNYLPGDLKPDLTKHGFDGSVLVQHLNQAEINHYFISLALDTPWIKGIVGWVDLCGDNVKEKLNQLSQFAIIKGVRHLVHNEPDQNFMLQPEFLNGISLLKKHGFAYDFVVLSEQLSATIEVVRRFPEQKFVLDHIAKPRISSGIPDRNWIKNIKLLAEASDNVYCKLSGIITEDDWSSWSFGKVRPYLDVVVEAFSYQRVMYGSDWPVCLAAGSYDDVYQLIFDYFSKSPELVQQQVFGLNAVQFYNL